MRTDRLEHLLDVDAVPASRALGHRGLTTDGSDIDAGGDGDRMRVGRVADRPGRCVFAVNLDDLAVAVRVAVPPGRGLCPGQRKPDEESTKRCHLTPAGARPFS